MLFSLCLIKSKISPFPADGSNTVVINLKFILSNPNITDIRDIYKGKAALILCAGPSLKENIEIYNSSINAIDPNSETSTSNLLTLLDSMNTTFEQMASLEVPEYRRLSSTPALL